ncbi:unnamed protein product [Parnassius mnemosyne]|uniref:Reverse transcriptase domain-containing protein n=1 Tax=Parnassius mnemosyne TaxID=213953 RepID=A0AAV1LL56_9NEOP
MGDFNTCLLKNDSRSFRLKSIVQAANLHILPLSATHFFPNCSPSLLDLILVSSIDHVDKHGQCPADAFSYHDLIYLSYKLRPPKPKSRILLLRNFDGMDLDRLRDEAAKIDWNVVLTGANIDERVNSFNSLLIQLYDVHAPIRPVRIKHLPAPWLTQEIKNLQRKKNFAKARYKFDNCDTNRDKYKKIRNHCNRLCRDKQRRYIHKSILDEDNSGRVWKFLKSLGVGKASQNSSPKNIDLNQLNQHFSSSCAIDEVTKIQTKTQISALPKSDNPAFIFSQITDSDVKKSIVEVNSDAISTDCISRKMIIPIVDILTPVIKSIFNYSISSGNFPSSWKEAQITPIPKKANPSSFSDYRPISIIPFLSKVFERIVHRQLSIYLSRWSLLNSFQSGFRVGHSTTTALVKITEDIRLSMDKQHVTVLTLLDFSNAFNNVDFDLLLAILASLNISPEVIDWFHSYLFGRRQRTRVDDSFSNWCTINAGVPQGGVLSPLLFSIFISSITLQLSSRYHLYADDLQVYEHAKLMDLPNTIGLLNKDLDLIVDWCKSYGLKVNPSKTKAIIIGSQKFVNLIDFSSLPGIIFDGTPVPYSDTVKNLGVTFDKFLSWAPQVSEVSRRMFASVGSLRRLSNFLPIPTKIALAQSLLLPILDYADTCYLNLNEEMLNKLERIQNLCIRFIFGLRKYDHVSEYREKLKWLPIRLRRNTHILSLLYCILFNPTSPTYLKERFEFLGDNHCRSLRSDKNLTLKIPSHNTSFYSKSFSVEAVRLWNSLPLHIRSAQSIDKFKKLVKAHFFPP